MAKKVVVTKKKAGRTKAGINREKAGIKFASIKRAGGKVTKKGTRK